MAATLLDVQEVGRALGLDEAAVDTVVLRAGGVDEALVRLKGRQRRLGAAVLRNHEAKLQDAESDRRRAAHEKRRKVAREEREGRRRGLSLPERLAECLGRAETLAGLSTGSWVGGGRGGAPDSVAPPRADNEAATYYGPRLRALVSAFERDLDIEQYGADGHRESVDDRDQRLVRDFEGWSAAEVVAFDRSVNSIDTVNRARLKHGREVKRGRRAVDLDVA